MLKYTLVPAAFFKKDNAYNILSEAVQLSEEDKVGYKELPRLKAVLVYAYTSEDKAPAIAALLDAASGIRDHNKVAVHYGDGYVTVTISIDQKLLLANSYPAAEPITAEYFVFAALKQFQINPQVTTIYMLKPTCGEMADDFVRYFKGVETL